MRSKMLRQFRTSIVTAFWHRRLQSRLHAPSEVRKAASVEAAMLLKIKLLHFFFQRQCRQQLLAFVVGNGYFFPAVSSVITIRLYIGDLRIPARFFMRT